MDIAEGMSVECLICMHTFPAANPVECHAHAEPARQCSKAKAGVGMPPEAASPPPAPSPPGEEGGIRGGRLGCIDTADTQAPKGQILIAKPYVPPSAITGSIPNPVSPAPPIAETANPSTATQSAPPPRFSSGSGARGESGKNIALLAATGGLLLVLTVGIVIAAWKFTASVRSGATSKELLYVGDPSKAVSDISEKKQQKTPADQEAEDDLRIKIQEEVRQVLKRKASVKPGSDEQDWDLGPLNRAKQAFAGLDQQRVSVAIDKGIAYLRKTQNPDGTWSNGRGVGYAAIGGLTLLECNIAAKDPAVQKAAAYVRSHIRNLNATYEISLAILFLDRLADPRDRSLIQGMALRLLAGQNDFGGWSYNCSQLNPQEMFQLYTFLQSQKQPNLLNPLLSNPKTHTSFEPNPKRGAKSPDDPFVQLSELIRAKGTDGTRQDPQPDPLNPGVAPRVDSDPKNAPKPGVKPIPPANLPANLRNLPVVKHQGLKKGQTKLRQSGGDNSNTQFAMLALWAARRHFIPTDQALLASYQRFVNSQNAEGGWGYMAETGSTGSMTNVGLLGLAFGHGAAPDIMKFNPKNPKDIIVKPALEDPTIQKGLTALSRYIGQPSLDPKKTNFPMENLYFLWSVERVAMLYDLKTIAGKDWYAWGAQLLVHNQRADGDWASAQYPGATPPLNTCFALLFLRRSNLIQDLTNNLRLTTAISDPAK
jgi:hypothetical protein